MKRVLITGITGYIGSRLARTLLADNAVYGLVRHPLNKAYLTPELQEKVTLLPYDGSGENVLAALQTSRPDIVYHLATYYTAAHDMQAITQLVGSNLALGTCLLEAMGTTGCRRLVYATTVTTHCAGTGYQPLTLYAATKQAYSDIVEYYCRGGFLTAAEVALSDTYGPGDQRPKVLNLIRQAVLAKEELDLTSGRQTFDAVYIDDVVQGFLKAANALEHGAAGHQFFQLASAEPRSLRDTVELMLQVNHLSFRANWCGRADPAHITEHPIRIYPEPPGWEQQVLLAEGLRRFWTGTSQ